MSALSRPRPVLTASGIAGLITSLAGVLAWLGYSNASTSLSAESTTLVSVVIGAVTLGSHLLAGLHAQGKVTPLANPQTGDGQPLVALSTVAPLGVLAGPEAVGGPNASDAVAAADAIYPAVAVPRPSPGPGIHVPEHAALGQQSPT